ERQLRAGLDDNVGAALKVNIGASVEGVILPHLLVLIAGHLQRLRATDFLVAVAADGDVALLADLLEDVAVHGKRLVLDDLLDAVALDLGLAVLADGHGDVVFHEDIDVPAALSLALADGELQVALDLL